MGEYRKFDELKRSIWIVPIQHSSHCYHNRRAMCECQRPVRRLLPGHGGICQSHWQAICARRPAWGVCRSQEALRRGALWVPYYPSSVRAPLERTWMSCSRLKAARRWDSWL